MCQRRVSFNPDYPAYFMATGHPLKSFAAGSRAAVIGATGGIGRAIIERLVDSGSFERIHALSRSGTGKTRPGAPSSVSEHRLDFDDPRTIGEAAAAVADEGPLDFVFIATGILHDGDAIQPEKSMRDIEADRLERVFAINTIGPVLVAKHFLPLMRPKRRTVFAALSARVGSISDNRLGGWIAYRSSKAALNMALKTLSIEQARSRPESIVVALHPGTVRSALSEPFTERVPDDKLFSPEKAAEHLLAVVDGLEADDTGGFFAWDGKPVSY